jgi:hypothetical protein
VITTALQAQEFRYKLNKQPFYAESKGGIQLIHHDSTGYIIYISGAPVPGKSINKLCKLDSKFSITDSIILPNLKQNRVQQFFKTKQGIGWYHDYYNSDSSARYYEITQLTFGKEKLKKIALGKIENWQSGLPKVVGCNLGFSSDQKMLYYYLWKEKSKTEEGWISEITVLDMNLDCISKTSVPDNFGAGTFWSENVVLTSDTTFYWVMPVLRKEPELQGFANRPDTVTGLNLQTWHLPSDTKTNYLENGINQGINNFRLIYDNTGKLHFVGFYTFAKNYNSRGFFDYIITDNKELRLLNNHLFTRTELEDLKIKNYDLSKETGKESGLSSKYEFQRVRYNPAGSYDYFIESYSVTFNKGAVVVPLGGGFIAGAMAGAAAAYMSAYEVGNPEYDYDPMIIIRKPLPVDSYTFFVFPVAQSSKISGIMGVYYFEYQNSSFLISNESRQNAKKTLDEWDYFSHFTNKGQACITSVDDKNSLKRHKAFPTLDQNPAVINVRQIVRVKENDFFVVVKPDANSDEHYLGKLIITD